MTFDELYQTYINGNISDHWASVKKLSRGRRAEYVSYVRSLNELDAWRFALQLIAGE